MLKIPAAHGVSSFMIGHRGFLFLAQHSRFLLQACAEPEKKKIMKVMLQRKGKFNSCSPATMSLPPITRSIAASKCCKVTLLAPLRAAINAASLHTLAISAPEKPGVIVAIFFATSSLEPSRRSGFKCTLNISRRPWVKRTRCLEQELRQLVVADKHRFSFASKEEKSPSTNLDVWKINGDLSVKPARPHQSCVEDIRPVCTSQYHNIC